MNNERLIAVSSSIVAFTTALGVLSAMIYHMFLIINVSIFEAIVGRNSLYRCYSFIFIYHEDKIKMKKNNSSK